MNDRKRRQTARKAARNVYRFSWRPSPALHPPGRWEQEAQGLSDLPCQAEMTFVDNDLKFPIFNEMNFPIMNVELSNWAG